MYRFIMFVLFLVAGTVFLASSQSDRTSRSKPLGPEPVCPDPKPCPNCPDNPRKPWGTLEASPVGDFYSTAPDGTEPEVDYPKEQWFANIGSRVDGAGMCVFTSFEMMCRQAGLEEFRGFRDWCASNYRGGGYPEKLASLISEYCKRKNIPVPRYYQYEGTDLTFLKNSLRSGRFACCTLYYSSRYGGRISHMVNCAHANGPRFYAICDNNQMRNDPIPPYEWFDGEAKFHRAIGDRYWAVVLERPGLPCSPKN